LGSIYDVVCFLFSVDGMGIYEDLDNNNLRYKFGEENMYQVIFQLEYVEENSVQDLLQEHRLKWFF
jgi:hypothetical protein